jgi:uncharacterized FlgJ-related protein
MLYVYCQDSLQFKQIRKRSYVKCALAACIFSAGFSYLTYCNGSSTAIKNITVEERITIVQESDKFSQQKMATMMRDLNIKFAWIPMAQSILETGHWKSDIFLENNNLFGMKEAKSRITTATGTNKQHAEYDTWRESVYDYAFYQSRYLSKIKTEDAYYEYLNASYAEDPNYITKIKQMVKRKNLKQIFK